MTTFLVASTGGHLAQLKRLLPRLVAAGLDHNRTWITFESPQSRSLLAGERVRYLHPIASRDWTAVVRNQRRVQRIFAEQRPDRVISTGSAIALSVFPAALARGIRCHYIESAARSEGPSLTGRILERTPRVALYTQYPSWASGRWNYAGSVFDDFRMQRRQAPVKVRSALITLGTVSFTFPRLVDRLAAVVPKEVEAHWQLGETPAPDGIGPTSTTLPAAEIAELTKSSDVVVAHSGIGSALMSLEMGKLPILSPRRVAHGEHIDDHQIQIARELNRRGLAIHADAAHLTWDQIESAARHKIVPTTNPTPFPLVAQ